MIRKVIRLEYAFASEKQIISVETTAFTNEECTSQIERILSQLSLNRKNISKIELLEIFE